MGGGSKYQTGFLLAASLAANMHRDSAVQNGNCPTPDQIRETDRQ